MVPLPQVKASNANASSTLPAGLVAVFAGATSGIGEMTLKAFAKHTLRPKIYFIGRSQEAADRILETLKELNPEGNFNFVKADMSLLKNVDDVCRDLKKKETSINVLYMSQGSLSFGADTSEGLPYITGLTYYSRTRLAVNLLPLLRQATSLRRVVTTMAGTKEGPIFIDDLPGRKVSFLRARGHLATALTLSLESLARQAPEVSFIHNFPGAVDTYLIRSDAGLLMKAAASATRLWFGARGKFVSEEECGERHTWLCLSGRYPPKVNGADAQGVPSEGVATGSDNQTGSGVYSVDWDGETAPKPVVELLQKHRKEGMVEKVWAETEREFKRITGTLSI
ncbi:Fc.00g058910.m01.CDS01 [Cosmosporella sp. VM-42]